MGHGTIARITGHKTDGSVLPKFYIDVSSLPERVAALAKFEAGVSIAAYRLG